MNEAVEIVKARREEAISELVGSIIEVVPRYAVADAAEVRRNVEGLFDVFLEVVETKDTTRMMQILHAIADQRAQQGFSAADFQRALLLIYPVVRRIVRQAGPRNDAGLAHSFQEFEDAVFRSTAVASNVFSAALRRQTEKKLTDAEKQTEALRQKTQELEQAVVSTRLQLREVQELNERIIDSLNSAVLVLEHPTARILLASQRLNEILGLRPEEAVDRTALELAPRLKGLPIQEIVATVQTMDRLPLTKVELELASGQKKVVFLRAERLHQGSGDAIRGTVLIIDDVTERELLIDSFSRYVSRDVVQRLLSRSHRTNRLERERRFCSVLFADIRGFTGLSERIGLEALHEMLNQYFRVMVDQVSRHDGNIDKFIGDKIMAVFTGRDGDGSVSATRAALGIQQEIAALNRTRGAGQGEAIEVGIGINTGEVVMGTIGSEERMSFTVIGDAVNVADRLQSLAGAGEIYVGQRTRQLLGDRFEFDELGERPLKGRASVEHIFKVLRER